MTNIQVPTASEKWTQVLDFSGLRFKTRTETTGITVHCSASRPSQNWGAADVDRMHRQRGFFCIGYHFIITRDGRVELGRPLAVQGAHAKDGGRNATHVGVCLIGGISEKPQSHIPGSKWNGSDAEANFTHAQLKSLDRLLRTLKANYGLTDADIEGHRDIPGVTKACPSFNVAKFLAGQGMHLD